MLILSHADARGLFLGIAQLIPVFLIALFVMDNAWISKSINEAKSSVAMALDAAAKVVKDQESKIERTVESQLRELDEFAATYNSPEARSVATKTRAKILDLTGGFRKQGKDMLDTLSDRLAYVVKREEVAARKRASIYARATIATIVPGMLGEIISLWGAAGLADNSVIIGLATAISVGIAGILSVLAIDRLIAEPPSGRLLIIRIIWISVLCAATLTTFFWILFSVQVRR
jgi:hypothetical protein